jgi:hypothetical protein
MKGVDTIARVRRDLPGPARVAQHGAQDHPEAVFGYIAQVRLDESPGAEQLVHSEVALSEARHA